MYVPKCYSSIYLTSTYLNIHLFFYRLYIIDTNYYCFNLFHHLICSNSTDCEECGNYVRHLFSFVPGSLAVIGVLALVLFQAPQTNCKRNGE